MTASLIQVCQALTAAISRASRVEEIYDACLDALATGLGVSRASILLFDADDVMRFKAWRGLSETYRRAVEGHTPWQRNSPDPQPITVPDVQADPSLADYLPIFQAEGIAALGFVPMVTQQGVIGKFMLYYPAPHAFTEEELQLASVVAAQVAFAVQRTIAEEAARRSETRLRFALDAAEMGTWDWDLVGGTRYRSENMERIHHLPPGSLTGEVSTYLSYVHPDDREMVSATLRGAMEGGESYDMEYRIVTPEGMVHWVEGKGRVELADGRPVRMSGVCMVVTRRKEAELARLASAREVARQQDEFLAVLSHELRTPLNAILGWVQILRHTPERLPEVLEIIDRNARQQSQLIEDILDVSRIITGTLGLERAPLALQPVLEDALRAAAPLARVRGIDLTSEIAPGLPMIEGDARRLRQVLDNLLGNALKFTSQGGRISLAAASTGGGIRIAVADSGAGIPRDVLPHVFDRFRQADSRTTRQHGGLGLGLAIARHVVEEHGGTIAAASDGPGCGTTMTVELPVAVAGVPGVVGSPALVDRSSLHGVTALVVDDHDDSRELLREVLAAEGLRVIEASSATEALSCLDEAPLHILLADLAMPGLDGFGLIRKVRERRQDLPAIAVSAMARPADRARALEAGFDDFQTKPIEADGVVAAVRRLVQPYLVEGSFSKR